MVVGANVVVVGCVVVGFFVGESVIFLVGCVVVGFLVGAKVVVVVVVGPRVGLDVVVVLFPLVGANVDGLVDGTFEGSNVGIDVTGEGVGACVGIARKSLIIVLNCFHNPFKVKSLRLLSFNSFVVTVRISTLE